MRYSDASLLDAAARIQQGEATSTSLVESCLAQVRDLEPAIHAWAHLDEEAVREQARQRDTVMHDGGATGPLHGVPIGIKDIVDTAGTPTEYGCDVFAGRVPIEDAWLVRRLKEAGAVIMGKTVTAEMATFSPGPTTNPHDTTHTPGGSSSGSAAAVAASMVPGAIGSQTVGSVVRPASFCGVYGFKPTYGLIPRQGVLKQSPFLDQIGVFARSIADAALLAETIIGSHLEDAATRAMHRRPQLLRACRQEPLAPPRFGFVRTSAWNQADPATQSGLETLVAALGARAFEIELPRGFDSAWDWHKVVNETEISAHYGGFFETCMERVSDSLQGQIRRGREARAVDYIHAMAQRETLNSLLDEIFDGCDALITPAAAGEAPAGLTSTGNPVFCTTWTFCGVPAVNLPLLKGNAGLPVGVQLVGRRHGDGVLLRSARWLANNAGST